MSTPDAVDPVCARHPDRATRITCARCDRPICPECMIVAPVGFQCPECVGLARRQTPEVRTVFGAPVISRPTITYGLIGLNVVAFVASWLLGEDSITGQFGMYPPLIALDGQWWRLLTSAFLHYGILHLAFNMYVLFALGPALERALGHGRYLVLYVIAALSGTVASFVLSPVEVNSVGASGAIFGLMGALVIAGRRLRYDIRQVLVLIGINVAIGFLPGSSIDWRAHLGGLVGGAVIATIFTRGPQRARLPRQGLLVAGYLALLVALVVWRVGDLSQVFGAIPAS